MCTSEHRRIIDETYTRYRTYEPDVSRSLHVLLMISTILSFELTTDGFGTIFYENCTYDFTDKILKEMCRKLLAVVRCKGGGGEVVFWPFVLAFFVLVWFGLVLFGFVFRFLVLSWF